jgi:predicted nuclease with TOPRIM domain
MSTTAVETLESLQEALDPLDAYRSEQVELGSWIHDSFSALEKLHEELTQWQSELARKETELDLRQDALEKSPSGEKEIVKHSSDSESQPSDATSRIAELENALAAERERAALDRELWKEQFQRLRTDLEKYYLLLAQQLEEVVAAQRASNLSYTPLSAGAAHAKSVELRRRAQSRREANRRNNLADSSQE